MPSIEGLDPQQQTIFTTAFLIAMGIIMAWSYFSKKPKDVGKEIHINGQFSDMGPVKELVAQTGLLFQQQIRTNLALERLADAYEGQIAEERNEAEIEAEVARRLQRELDRERRARRRAVQRKPKGLAAKPL